MKLDGSIDIDTVPEVYNPSDDSYLLLEVVEVTPGQTFLEIGSGTGLVSIHAAKAGAKVTACDINPHSVDCTRINAARNGQTVKVIESDLFERVHGIFDVIAFNPPYLPGKAASTAWIEKSWSGGEDGGEVARRFLEGAWRHLAPGGRIYLILSSLGGITSVLKVAKERYECEMLSEKRMFFESIFAFRLKLRSRY